MNIWYNRQKEVICIKKRKGLSNNESRFITREAIKGALFIMMENQEISQIKIVELVKVAGVSRAAFYRNYNSVEDVLIDSVESKINEIIGILTNDLSSNWNKIITIFRKNKHYLDILNKSNHLPILLDCFNKQFHKDDYYFIGWNGLVYNFLSTWIKNGMKESDEELTKIIKECTKRMAKDIKKNKV